MAGDSRFFSRSLSISFSLPDDWSAEEQKNNMIVSTGPPRDSTGYPLSTLSFTLTAPKQESVAWLEELIKDSEAQQSRGYENYQILRQERFRLDLHWAYLRRSRWQPDGESDPRHHIQGLLWPGGEVLYIMKGAAPDAETLDAMETIFRSIRLESPGLLDSSG